MESEPIVNCSCNIFSNINGFELKEYNRFGFLSQFYVFEIKKKNFIKTVIRPVIFQPGKRDNKKVLGGKCDLYFQELISWKFHKILDKFHNL